MSRSIFLIAAGAAAACAALAGAQTTSPAEAASLTHTQVLFQWPPVGGASQYELAIVVDNGLNDPFTGNPAVVDVTVGGLYPRTVVTSGLSFGKPYAWHVRDLSPAPGPWGATHHFSTITLPNSLPTFIMGGTGGPLEPGITIFNLRANGIITGGLCVAVDSTGAPVWCLQLNGGAGDLRLLDNGHMLVETANKGMEMSLDGQVYYSTPNGLTVHHEVFPMPSGNVLCLVNTAQVVQLPGGGSATWNGSRIVEFDKSTNAIVFDWNEFDHFSTLDFDAVIGGGDWTHSNAVIYDASDHSIYHSSRHLSRITHIDYPSGNILYEMGFNMPSGDVDFGDDLFSFQHAPEILPNGHLMLFDNGNRRHHIVQTPQTGQSKAIELAFSGGNPPTSASIVWSWDVPFFETAVGDCDRLANGNTLVVGGVTGSIWEVAPDYTVVWSLQCPGNPSPYLIYRADRIPSLIPPLPPDLNGDGIVNGADLGLLLGSWGPCSGCPADINNDGVVDGADLALLLGAWGM